ncbi:MAG TPA: hypothetical protein VFO52_06125 [Longimicrobiales bacterium]|nr:hypothetical protein [Longimicrobiales bacterium]
MSAITHFLFPAPAARSTAAIFVWWEHRRLGYNAVMAVTGLCSLAMMSIVAHLPPGSTELPPIALVVLYAIVANVFYWLGPVVECALELIWPGKLLPTGPTLFRMGLTFSVGLNFLPSLMMGWDWVIRVLKWLL